MTAVVDVDTSDAITEPGVYQLSHEQYHADPALSSSGARQLLPPSCPAKFRHEQLYGRIATRSMENGTLAHNLLLGAGPVIVTVDAPDWKTKAARDKAAVARLDGQVPILAHVYAEIEAMVAALKNTPGVAALLDHGWGTPESSIFWRDQPTSVMRRARLDWCPEPIPGRRSLLVDYKTSHTADPDEFPNTARKYGYHCQGAWYRDGAIAEGLAGEDCKFLFIVQETKPPYVASVIELDALAMRIGAMLNRRAIDLYLQCVIDDRWPGYTDDVALVSFPRWYEREHEEDL